MGKVVNIKKLHIDLGLTTKQRELLSNALDDLCSKYNKMANHTEDRPATRYFSGVADGLNHARKLIEGEDDDYNALN